MRKKVHHCLTFFYDKSIVFIHINVIHKSINLIVKSIILLTRIYIYVSPTFVFVIIYNIYFIFMYESLVLTIY